MADPKKILQQAQQIAKDEGLEILKTAGKQLAGGPASKVEKPEGAPTPPEAKEETEEQVNQRDLRRIEALEQEMKVIGARREEEYSQRTQEKFAPEPEEESQAPVEPPTKPKRGFFGPQARAEKAKRSTELGKSPTG